MLVDCAGLAELQAWAPEVTPAAVPGTELELIIEDPFGQTMPFRS